MPKTAEPSADFWADIDLFPIGAQWNSSQERKALRESTGILPAQNLSLFGMNLSGTPSLDLNSDPQDIKREPSRILYD